MGFISNIAGTISDSINSEIQDQYLEAFRTDSLGQEMLVKRAKRMDSKGFNKGNSEIISAGSKIIVPEGTYALMIDNGEISDCVDTPGLYTWETSSSASVLSGGVKSVLGDAFDRFRFAGEITKTQRIYYVNALEIMNQTCKEYLNVPYPDPVYGNLYFKFRIMFSFRIVDPIKFFRKTGKDTSVADFMGTEYSPKMPFLEVQDHMEEALNLCATRDKIPFPKLLSNKSILKDSVNEAVSKQWLENRGMVVESITIVDLTLDEKSRARVEQFDSAKLFADDPAALGALVALGLTEAMQSAASNPAGAVGGFAGMGMAGTAISDLGTVVPLGTANIGYPASNAAGSAAEPETCPFCGTPLPSGTRLEHCPACYADLKN